jgi:hypothetical protein
MALTKKREYKKRERVTPLGEDFRWQTRSTESAAGGMYSKKKSYSRNN